MRLKTYLLEVEQFRRKIIKVAIVMVILIVVVLLRLFYLQILSHEHYAKLASNNRLDYLAVEPNRGLIYDRNGVLLAENRPAFTLNIIADYAKDVDETIEALGKIITITTSDLKKFRQYLKNHVRLESFPLKQKLSMDELVVFYANKYRFPAVAVDSEMLRHYPLGPSMAHIIGYLGKISKDDLRKIAEKNYSPNSYLGKTGIEKYYENILRGNTGYKVVETGATGKIVRLLKIIKPVSGKTIYLTIDSNLQKTIQDAFGQEKGAAVVIDPNNGEILAMVSNPSYDPNLFSLGIDNDTFSRIHNSSNKPMYNRATLGQFSFASTIKPFIAIQALDTGLVSKDFTIDDPGWFKLENNPHIYRDWKLDGHGKVNLRKAIIVSCDVFFYNISLKLGMTKMAKFLEAFGFGKKINIDIAEEATGIVATPYWKSHRFGKPWYTGDTIIASIGQGFMTTTPLQLAHGIATISTRGKRFKPYLLKAVQNHDDTMVITKPISVGEIKLKDDRSWDLVIGAMEEVIFNPHGTAYHRFGSTPSYRVAGKTGEAQLYRRVQSVNKRIVPKHLLNHNLFIAFAPVDNPQIALAVITENSNFAVRIAKQILDYHFVSSNNVNASPIIKNH